MTDPWLIQSVEKNINQELNEIPIILQNDKQENLILKEKQEEEEVNNQNDNKQNLNQFEDNFAPTTTVLENRKNQPQVAIEKNINGDSSPHHPLADSAAYLKGLEIKLKKLRKSSKLLESLSAKREDCMRTLLDDNSSNSKQHNALNEPIRNGDSAVHEIYRHLQPIQAVTVGELVNILKHDQLTDNNEEADQEEGEIAIDINKEKI